MISIGNKGQSKSIKYAQLWIFNGEIIMWKIYCFKRFYKLSSLFIIDRSSWQNCGDPEYLILNRIFSTEEEREIVQNECPAGTPRLRVYQTLV